MSQSDHWEVFRSVAEYAKTLEALMPTKSIVAALEAQRAAEREVFDQLNTQAFQELTKSMAIVSEVAQEIANQNKAVFDALKHMDDIAHGIIFSSHPLLTIDRSLLDVAVLMKNTGHGEALKEFENPNKKIKNIRGDYTFSPTLEKLDKEEERLNRKEQIEAYGAWEKLELIKKVIYEPEKLNKETVNEIKNHPILSKEFQGKEDEVVNLKVQEMEQIRLGKDDIYVTPDFDINAVKGYVKRVHTYTTTEIILITDDKIPEISNSQNTSSTEEVLKQKSTPMIKIENDCLVFGQKKIAIERGQKAMIEIFLASAKIHRKNIVANNGIGVEIKKLQGVGGYKDEPAFRDGLKRLRAKLRKGGLPAIIENVGTGKYQMIIKYQ